MPPIDTHNLCNGSFYETALAPDYNIYNLIIDA